MKKYESAALLKTLLSITNQNDGGVTEEAQKRKARMATAAVDQKQSRPQKLHAPYL